MLIILAFGFLFNGIRILTGAFIVFYMLNRGITLIEIGIIKSSQAFIMMVSDIPLGYFADKKSYKISIVLSSAFSAVWLFLMGISDGFYGFLLAELFNALSLTLIAGAYNALLVQYSKANLETTKKIIGYSSQCNYVGMFLFSLVGAYFADYSGQYIWYVASFLMFITTIFGLIFIDNIKLECKAYEYNSFAYDVKEMFFIFKNSPYVSICFCFALIFINVFAQYWQWIFKYCNIEINYFNLGIVFSFILLSQLIASTLFTKLSEKQNIFIISIISLLMIFIIFFIDINKIYASILVCIIFYLIKYVSIRAEVVLHDSISDRLRATYESFLSTLVRLSLLIFFYFSAYMIDIFGFFSLVYIFIIFLFIYLFSIIFKQE